MSKAQTPEALWNCISELCSLRELNAWFQANHDARGLLGEDGKLLFPLYRQLGFRFSRTLVPGLSVSKHGRGLFSIYESRSLYEEHRLLDDWVGFARGHWSPKTPSEAGLYFVRAQDGYQSVRRLVLLPTGELHDATGGYVEPGRVTRWLGEWWSVRVPLLRDCK